jgi:RNA polymerase sigma factor (sigma-70 family)
MEHEMDDWALLRNYSEGRSEAAFAELVQRHGDLVYSSALRQMGDPHLAGDVAQAVFLSLARKGATISRSAVIPGWLIHATRRESANLLRDRARRSRREQLAAEMHSSATPNPLDAAWERVAPLLDEGLAMLREADRDAVVLHFLRRRTFREVGESLGLSEEAARKRVTRALDSLRAFLTGRGVSLPHTTLAAALVAFGVQPAPQAVAAHRAGRCARRRGYAQRRPQVHLEYVGWRASKRSAGLRGRTHRSGGPQRDGPPGRSGSDGEHVSR